MRKSDRKYKIVVASDHRAVAELLMIKILSDESYQSDLEIFYKEELIKDRLMTEDIIDLLIISEDYLSYVIHKELIQSVLILTNDQKKEEIDGLPTIEKLSNINILYSAVLKSLADPVPMVEAETDREEENNQLTARDELEAEEAKEEIPENAVGLHLTLIPKDGKGKMSLLIISEKYEGVYYFQDNSIKDTFIYIQGSKREWRAYCNDSAEFIRGNKKVKSVGLYHHTVETINYKGIIYLLFAEWKTPNGLMQHNYMFYNDQFIKIGRNRDNDIICNNRRISNHHASLTYHGGICYISDLDSTYGTYVNGLPITQQQLYPGDKIYIMGLIIIVGLGFLSINDQNGSVGINNNKLRYVTDTSDDTRHMPDNLSSERQKLFNRKPRIRIPMKAEEIIIEGPPMSMNGNQIPLLLRMGSSMVMGGRNAMMGNYTMVLTSLFFPFLSQRYTQEQRKKYEEKRSEKYTEYLQHKKEEILIEIEREKDVFEKNYPSLEKILSFTNDKKRLWERRKTDDDFLLIRVGTGKVPLQSGIDYPKERFNIEEDLLETSMFQLAERKYYIKDTAILSSLQDDFIQGIRGKKEETFLLAKNMIMQLTMLHSYDEVKTIFLINEEDLRKMEFVRFLPHSWNNQKNERYVASNSGDALSISKMLRREIDNDLKNEAKLPDILKRRPYFVVFAFDKKLFDSMEILKDVLKDGENRGVSVITIFQDLPKECSIVYEVQENNRNYIRYIKDIERSEDSFFIENVPDTYAEKAMLQISNLNLMLVSDSFSLPKSLSFLEMYGVGRIEHLNPLKRWESNNPTQSLAVPIGVTTDGSVFTLDLHEKFQGPHGLVAGTTGSGKSEFLLTYILSLALNFHPDEVAFLLIDYKGGGLAGAFDDPVNEIHLPHLAGTITNLDGASITRSLISIESELKRRQAVFNQAKSIVNEGTMDIYSYQKLYRSGVLEEPMPHLFIISDEFAELKQQQPEFLDQLVSAARIGRSLGVHLILATQKPSGIVSDQIRSNTKFRICLKVQDIYDSQDMLGRPEAAGLKETGRFYLQVGNNEYFALGQSGWSGAPYEATDHVVVKRDESIQFIDHVGRPLVSVKPKIKKDDTKKSQLVSIVKMLTDLAEKQGVSTRKLCLPELEKKIDIRDLSVEEEDNSIHCAIGLVDDPVKQKQFVASYNFEESHHLLIMGDAGSGKTTLLQSILHSLVSKYSPKDLNIYGFDFSSRLLKKYARLSHFGEILIEEDADKLEALFLIINKIVNERKALFAANEIDSFTAAKKKMDLPLIIVFIDNLAGMKATKQGERIYYVLQDYLKNSSKYGIKYIISCNYTNEIPSRLRQEIGDRICLHMADKYDYMDILNSRVTYTPQNLPGRGLGIWEERPMEFQAAMLYPDMEDEQRMTKLEEDIAEIKERYQGMRKPPRLPVVSTTATYEDFSEQFTKGRIPLGFDKNTGKPIALPFRQLTCMSIYQGNPEGRIPLIQNFIHAVSMNDADLWFLSKDAHKENADKIIENMILAQDSKIIENTYDAIKDLCLDLTDLVAQRVQHRINYCKKNGIKGKKAEKVEICWRYMMETTKPIVLMIEDFGEFCQMLDYPLSHAFIELFKEHLKGLNIYVLGFYGPKDPDQGPYDPLYEMYTEENIILLFGGVLDRQELIHFESTSKAYAKKRSPNDCIIQYRDNMYQITMPFGPVEEDEAEMDTNNIFE